ncbi:MAG: Bifunctional ribokinase/ribose-5-phosphate isomerase A [Owenweeksia sp. TMED14]|nr:MAG: Bifunctional ribokinase/ribose-5-phosphate isomerase A [Owenweeksia sp. TMED14]|tara:strand:+ start:135 stop:1049 length:915 start_codon:yes stop_codon:yes gene_type:complete
MSLLVVGTVAFDGLETPFGVRESILGGSATYIGMSAGYFIDKVNLVSVVGGDFPASNIDLLKSKKVDTEGLQIIKEGKTFFWKGKYHVDMNSRDTLDTQLNVLESFDPIIPESYKDCKYLMLGNLVPAIQLRVLEQLTVRPKLVVMDTMNLWMNAAMGDLKKMLKMVDVLTINDEEARQLSEENNLVVAAEKIRTMGPSILIIKKGEHGALLFGKEGQVFFSPAMPLSEVVDPTGAGDTFAGGFMGYLAQTDDISFKNMKKALIYASTMASFCVEKFGPERLENLKKSDIEFRRDELINLVDID